MIGYGVGEPDTDYALANMNPGVLQSSVAIPGHILVGGFTVSNTNVAAQFIWIFDAHDVGSLPSTPCYWVAVAGSGDREISYLPPREFNTGIVLANSTSATTFTAGVADCFFDVQFQTLA